MLFLALGVEDAQGVAIRDFALGVGFCCLELLGRSARVESEEGERRTCGVERRRRNSRGGKG